MNEIIFVIENAPEGGYTAKALGEAIFTEADDLTELHRNVREAVSCHFDEEKAPRIIRLDLLLPMLWRSSRLRERFR